MRLRPAQLTARGAKLADFESLEEARAWLDGHVNLEAVAGKTASLSLEPMAKLLVAQGNPQYDYLAIHITGTNGKGSVAAMIGALAHAWGMSVGIYSSPHVEQINERLVHNGEPIADDDLVALLSHLRLVEGHLITAGVLDICSWFELVTAAALRWFADVAVDLAVVEVGKLGRYDATNLVRSRVGVITNIGFDHTDGLPGWQQKVMDEKAGILHPDAVAVLGVTDPELVALAARQSPADLLVAQEGFVLEQNIVALGGRVVTVRTPRACYEDIFVSLFGEHQGQNAAVAIAAFEALVEQELDEAVLAALGEVAVPARFEVLCRQPLVIIDGAHNPNGMAAAATTLQAEFDVHGVVIWVVGMMADKDPAAMLEAISTAGSRCDLLICCTPDWPRALPAADLATVARDIGITVEVLPRVSEAVERALELVGEASYDLGKPQDSGISGAVMIAGSLYVAGAARLHLLRADG
ncbi:MAG: bifunctional folylpolyglutamate synthase/dihydrofolate synthase [Acidimicrobiia bacterium]|nr:bifunctional folylpolyglutamate synthase/dihydrofolate synthase [Acidimicrobiia bacterium]